MAAKRFLDLAELDAEAAHLDLEVGAAQELEVAVRQPADEVTGAVEVESDAAAESELVVRLTLQGL